jgi:hypothetical protein
MDTEQHRTLLSISFPPPAKIWSTNQRVHHYERAALTKEWKGATRLFAARYRKLPPGIVQIWLPFKDERRRDPHNYCGTVLKAIIDGLVMAGCWPDDTPEWVGHREPVIWKGKEVIVEVWPKEDVPSR